MLFSLTYLQFHALFVLPALVALGATTPFRLGDRRTVLTGIAILAVLATLYTTPWDRFLIRQGAWWYGQDRVALRAASIPLGEYLFFLFQPVLVGLWVSRFPVDTSRPLSTPAPTRLVGIVAGALVGLTGLAVLRQADGLYLGLLLAWSAPILAIQWAFGWPYLVARRRVVALGTFVPMAYLWVVDRVAIALDVWSLSDAHTTGLTVPLLGLPIEEAAFFLLTSLFVVQGLVLYVWLVDRWR